VTYHGWAVLDADWNHWPDGLSDEATVAAVAAAGFAGIEVGVYRAAEQLAPARLERLRVLGAVHGCPVSALLVSLPVERWPHGALVGDAHAVAFEVAAAARTAAGLGLHTLGVWPGGDPEDASWAALVDGARRIVDAAGEYDVRVALEYKPGTAVRDVSRTLDVCADVPGLGILLDTGHAFALGEDPAEIVRRLAAEDLLWHLHLGDAPVGGGDDDLPLGRIHDLSPLVSALADVGYEGAGALDLYGAVSAGLVTGTEAGRESLAALATAGYRADR
jgi:sugar phosphate isomerase/epimerase